MRFLLPLLLLFTSLTFADSGADGDPCRRLSNPKEVERCRQVLSNDEQAAQQDRQPAESFAGYMLKGAKVVGAIGAGMAGIVLLGVSLLLVTGAPIGAGGC